LWTKRKANTSSSKTSLVYCQVTKDEILESLSERWPTSGILLAGELLMLSTWEYPSAGVVSSSLADVLETSPAEVLFKPEGLRRNPAQSKQAGQEAAGSIGEGITATGRVYLGSGKDIANCIPAELYHHGSVVNQDANNGHVVVHEE
jgi:hypothetical protein